MKKYLIISALVALLSLSLPKNSGAQVWIRVKPAPVVIGVRPPSPHPHHVWVDGEWFWNPRMRRYEWREGYWIVPPHGRHVWVPGYWRVGRRGYFWVRGHWR